MARGRTRDRARDRVRGSSFRSTQMCMCAVFAAQECGVAIDELDYAPPSVMPLAHICWMATVGGVLVALTHRSFLKGILPLYMLRRPT
jgi:hypothetical protein